MTVENANFLILKRLQVSRRGHLAYDQKFHEGVNIIRGENGSGKSTIADFIFYILGGDFDDWKDKAEECDEVQAEVATPNGIVTLKRAIGKKTTPVDIFFGSLENAQEHSLEGWQKAPLRRQASKHSFSQIMFNLINVPEAQSEGAANITNHQILRLLYADQRTPASRLFRFESFDTQTIREAVGDLMCGISGYDIYETTLAIRDKQKVFEKVSAEYTGLLKAMPEGKNLHSPIWIRSTITSLIDEKKQLKSDIETVDSKIDENQTKVFLAERKKLATSINKTKSDLKGLESLIEEHQFELVELGNFRGFLENLSAKLKHAEHASETVGSIEFSHCPACLAELKLSTGDVCNLCGEITDPDEEKAKYAQIKLDVELQTRETNQLINQKEMELKDAKAKQRGEKSLYAKLLTDYSVRYDISSAPREAYLAEKNNRIGQIDQEISYLNDKLTLAEQMDALSLEKQELQAELQGLKDRLRGFEQAAAKRRSIALTNVSRYACSILKDDMDRQEEFQNAENTSVNFHDDAIAVDGKMNFAESSNVFLKNTVILSLLLAAGNDPKFYHPKFLLFDNIEDKGMEPERSHLFQRIIVERATELEVPFQIIFTTSMMNPQLELDDYTIGPHYDHDNRTLDLGY
tara:strand:- start:30621 stop:32525 length:1905 start_codon:yes stop_codon:yes gene_type:complete